MSRRRRPRKTGDRTPAGVDQVLEVLADGLRVAKVVVLGDERFEECVFFATAHLAALHGLRRRRDRAPGGR